MSGIELIQKIHRLEDDVDSLGLRMVRPQYHSGVGYGNTIALIPKDASSLPVYSRDAEIFIGTLEELDHWLIGVAWARNYDILLRLSDPKKRERKEQDKRNHNLMNLLKR